jgi:integrase
MATRLTALKVENARSNPSKRIEIADAGKPGLYLVIQTSGRKSWAVRYRRRADRATRKFTIDGFPSLAVARKLAQEALDKAAEGHDPATDKIVEKRQAQARAAQNDPADLEVSVREFLRRHTRKRNGEPIRDSTRRETARLLGLKPEKKGEWVKTGGGVLQRWKGRTIASIGKGDVLDLLDDLVETGPVNANRTLAALKTFFGWCVERDRLDKSPCAGVKDPSPERERERVLKDGELAALWRAAEADQSPFGWMTQLLILTGCRRDEVRDAQWAEFDLPGRLWAIPAARIKNGREHRLPLSDSALRVLDDVPRIHGRAGLLFTTTGKTPISGLSKAKRRLHEAMSAELKAEPERWTLHDIRRTVITGLQRLGFPMEIAEAVANHKSGTLAGVAGIYGRHDYAAEKKTALDAWARFVDALLGDVPAKVVSLPRRSRAGLK